MIAEFQDVESGRKADRVGLAAALALCRSKRAILLIAKLDLLARSVAFISNLMESGVDFLAADMPTVNRLTIHVLAAVAEHEREMISQRTKEHWPQQRCAEPGSATRACRRQAHSPLSQRRPRLEARRAWPWPRLARPRHMGQ